MGWVMMSERDVRRLEVLSQIEAGNVSVRDAAAILCVSERQIFRLLKRFRDDGVTGIVHQARGRVPNNRISDVRRDYVLSIVKERYADFGPTLAAEMLEDHHGLTVSRETLRQWMVADGVWKTRAQRRRFHQPRLRRECFGELIQIDGSEHRWFEDRGPICTLLVFIDDATGKLMHLQFVSSESTWTYFDALRSPCCLLQR